MEYQYLLKNLPVIVGIIGLILVITGLFLKGWERIYFNLLGIIFIIFFLYKLFLLQNNPQIIQGVGGLSNPPKFYLILLTGAGINILAFFLWFYAILKVSFENRSNSLSQKKILFLGVFILIIELLIVKILGIVIAGFCFPILAFGYFIAVNNFTWKIKTV